MIQLQLPFISLAQKFKVMLRGCFAEKPEFERIKSSIKILKVQRMDVLGTEQWQDLVQQGEEAEESADSEEKI